MAKTLEELFQKEKAAVGKKPKEQRMQPKSLEDIFGTSAPSAPTEMIEVDPAGEEAALRVVGKNLFALPIGAARGATLNWSKELEPKSVKDMTEDYGLATGIGTGIGSILSGSGLARGLGLASKVPGLASLGTGGVRSQTAIGGLAGLLQNPEGRSRLENAQSGAIAGAVVGGATKPLMKLADQSEIYDKMMRPGFGKELEGKIAETAKLLNKDYIEPRKKDLMSIIRSSKEEIPFNPDYLRGFKREKARGSSPPEYQGKKGGMDRLAALMEAKGKKTFSAKNAQRLKEYFQDQAGYSRRRPFESGSVAKEEGAETLANMLKGRLEGIDPNIGRLNTEMSDAITLRENILEGSRNDPFAFLASKPFTGRGQQVLDIDALAKSKLSELSERLREARQLQADYDNIINPLMSAPTVYRKVKKGVGSVASGVRNKTPKGTKEGATVLGTNIATPPEEE